MRWPPARGDRGDDPLHLVARHDRSGGIRRRGDDDAAGGRVPVPLDEFSRQLVVRFRTDRNAHRGAFEHPDEVAVARVRRVGLQDAIVAVDDQRQHQQQRCRRARGDDDAFGRDRHAIVVGVVPRDRRAQRRQAQRRRVENAAVGDGALRGGDDGRRRGEVRFADLHVDHRAAGGFERACRRLHLHHMERGNVGNAGGRLAAGFHRKS